MSDCSIFYRGDGKTNVAYNCLDRHFVKMKFDAQEDALLWDGNYWDGDVHDVSEVSWESVDVVVKKTANMFSSFCRKGDCVLLFLPNVVQLPISILAASRIGVETVVVSAIDCTTEMLTEILEMSNPKVVVTLDAFFQGTNLVESKKIVDESIGLQNKHFAKVLVIRHCSPNEGVPPPEIMLPARRPFYGMEFALNLARDVEWSKLFRTAPTEAPELEWMNPHDTFAILPIRSPHMYLRSISIKEILDAISKLSSSICAFRGPILSLPVPSSLFSLAAIMCPWFTGKCLSLYEGRLDYPDPSRLNHLISKFEIETLLIEHSNSLDVEYLNFVSVPTLKVLITDENTDINKLEVAYPGTPVIRIIL